MVWNDMVLMAILSGDSVDKLVQIDIAMHEWLIHDSHEMSEWIFSAQVNCCKNCKWVKAVFEWVFILWYCLCVDDRLPRVMTWHSYILPVLYQSVAGPDTCLWGMAEWPVTKICALVGVSPFTTHVDPLDHGIFYSTQLPFQVARIDGIWLKGEHNYHWILWEGWLFVSCFSNKGAQC